MKFCIGIISYLPDDTSVRNERWSRVVNLIEQLDKHFNLPILLIAQNYKGLNIDSENIIRYDYNKLGITGARIKLREKFLELDYDYIIMLDDDMELSDNQADYDKYLSDIIRNRKDYYCVQNFLNNFSAISKNGFKKVNYDANICAENGTGFEDWIFNVKCRKYLSSMKLDTKLPKYERKHFLNDKYSTWLGDEALSKKNSDISSKIVKQIRTGK